MDDVKAQFPVDTVPILRGVSCCRLRACDDFSMLESNYVRGSRDIHETLMHVRNDTVGNDRDLHFFQFAKGETAIGGMLPAYFQSHGREFSQPGKTHAHGALTILDLDTQEL